MNNNIITFYRQNNFHKILSAFSAVMVLLSFNLCSTLAEEYHDNKRNKTIINTNKNGSSVRKCIAPAIGGTGAAITVAGILYYVFHDSDKNDTGSLPASPTTGSGTTDDPAANFASFKTCYMPFSEEYWPELPSEKINKYAKTESTKVDISKELIETLSSIDKDILNRIHFIQGNIADLQKPVGAIVNAANNHLVSGSGVCGAIYKAAGAGLGTEIKSLKTNGSIPSQIQNGSAVITGSHNIENAEAIIHTPGPDLRGTMNQPIHPYLELASAYGASIHLAHNNGLKSIAFPSISTGIFEFPAVTATIIAVHAVAKALKEYTEMDVYFVVWPGAKNFDEVMKELNKEFE